MKASPALIGGNAPPSHLKMIDRRRKFCWLAFIALLLTEWMAVFIGKPSILGHIPALSTVVASIGNHIPLVHEYAKCAKRFDSGSGLMLAVNVVLFPFKVGVMALAYRDFVVERFIFKWNDPEDWWTVFKGVLFALLCCVPALMWYTGFDDASRSSSRSLAKTAAGLCVGGWPSIISTLTWGNFAVLGMWLATLQVIGLSRTRLGAH